MEQTCTLATTTSSISVLDAQTFALKSSVPIRLGAVAGLLSPFGAFVSTQNAASIPFLQDMIEFRYTPLDYVFMTSRSSEISALDQAAGWVRTGLRFKVLSSAGVSGTIPLYRYFFAQVARQATRGTHFYTAVASEIEALRVANPTNSSAPRLPYNEGIDSYVYPPLVEGIGGSCATNQSPIYRLFRGPTRFPDDANHRFTSDKSLYDSYVKGGWDGEGVKFCAPI